MTPPFPAIGDVACIAMEGVDARRFAQLQFSGNVEALAPEHWQWNAWLTAQGRVRALMHLADLGNDGLLIVLRGGDAEATHAGLTRYLLRMRTTLTLQTFTAHAGGPVAAGVAGIEPDGTIVLGYGERSLRLTHASETTDAVAQAAWRRQEILQGWPTLPGHGGPEFLPPALGLERLGAVAFDKGCYPGQEIAARLHYRGGHKYRLCHLRGPEPVAVGSARDTGDGASTVWILDTVTVPDGVEILTVMPVTVNNNINNLEDIFSIVSIFDA